MSSTSITYSSFAIFDAKKLAKKSLNVEISTPLSTFLASNLKNSLITNILLEIFFGKPTRQKGII